ncbi:protein C-ets-2 [Platysternon megacephalum]|uniref:Protein C-ets-2 n=1 Tax=Platysternon megacephalum TaxID=55544 RepID=A0A4D9DSC1_9SAUR|nr:protein C-ets-2 [Platysternon megacephalum]
MLERKKKNPFSLKFFLGKGGKRVSQPALILPESQICVHWHSPATLQLRVRAELLTIQFPSSPHVPEWQAVVSVSHTETQPSEQSRVKASGWCAPKSLLLEVIVAGLLSSRAGPM